MVCRNIREARRTHLRSVVSRTSRDEPNIINGGFVFNINVSTNCYDPTQWRGIVFCGINMQLASTLAVAKTQIGKSSRKMFELHSDCCSGMYIYIFVSVRCLRRGLLIRIREWHLRFYAHNQDGQSGHP